MRRMVWVVVLVLLLAGQVVGAQEESSDYRLREPSLDEYLVALSEVAQQDDYWSSDLWVTMQEIDYRYDFPLIADYGLLLENITALQEHTPHFAFHAKKWHESVVLAWLLENNIDLAIVDRLRFDGYEIKVTPRDYNADGLDEYLLEVEEAEFSRSSGYILIQVDEVDGYRVIETPVVWQGGGAPNYSVGVGSVYEVSFDDLNADGLPEWVLVDDRIGSHSTYLEYWDILAWREGRMVKLNPEVYVEKEYAKFELLDSNGDGVQELVQQKTISDNWGCDQVQITTYSWDGELYTQSDDREVVPQSFGCLLREAEVAVWAGNIPDAVPLYEHALRREHRDPRYLPFAYMRLALAYALNGQPDLADWYLAELTAYDTDFTDEAFQVLAETLQTAYQDGSAGGLCYAAYEYLTEEPYLFWQTYDIHVGRTQDYHELYPMAWSMWSVEMPLPALIGCDVVGYLAMQTLTTDETPPAQLEVLGIPVAEALSADFNGDGQEDWVVWLPALHLPPLFFAHDGLTYQMSTLEDAILHPASDKNQFLTHPSPDGAGLLLFNFDFEVLPYRFSPVDTRNPQWGCMGNEDGNYGKLHVWRKHGTELQLILDAGLCEEKGIPEYFLAEDRISAWGFDVNSWIPAVFRWDGELEKYIKEEASTLPDNSLYYTWHRGLFDVKELLDNGESVQALRRIDLILRYGQVDERHIAAYHYHRAFILEMLGRPDEALAEFVAIYENAPDSVLGQLAALHLETVE